MFIIFLSISIIIFVISLVSALITRKNQKKAVTILLVGTIIATGFLTFPLYQEKDIITNLINTIFYTAGTITMTGEFEIVKNVPENLSPMYEYILYFYCILSPILTAGVIITFLESKLDELKANAKRKKTVHIFSEVNEKSVTLLETIKNKNNIIIIYNKENKKEYRERIKNKEGIILKKNITDLKLNQYNGKIKIYAISENQDENLNYTLNLLEENKTAKKDITIYVFSMNEEAQIILDSAEKHQIKTIIINEAQQMIYRMLDEIPLYKNTQNNTISALIIGAGRIGTETIKAISWCGQMIDHQLEINIIDKNANQIKKEFQNKYPELSEPNYQIKFHEADINTIDSTKILETECQKTNYIVIALGDDCSNLNCAIQLRRYFLRKNNKPIINIVIENEEKKKQIESLKNERGNHYDFHPFGSIKELYGKTNILNEQIEEKAKRVHLAYNPSDKKLKEYYKIEYYKKSSRAFALHIKYKLYSILKDEMNNVEKIQEAINNPKIQEKLAKNEHDRWNSYMRSECYKKASIKEVENYHQETNHHVHHLARLHPGLTHFENLDEISTQLSSIMNKTIDLKQSDYDIITKIPEIMKNNARKQEQK